MTDSQRHIHQPAADDVTVREVSDENDTDGTWRIRMPATSTAEARDGVAFDRAKVEGFAEQARDEQIPVFLDHGRNTNTGSRYSAAGRVGYIDNPDLRERDGVTDLVVDFVLLDPDGMAAEDGFVREALTLLRDQAEAGLPIASSIGWSDDTGDRDLPGDSDWLETSLVGIGSDARTTTASAEPAPLARAVSAASSDFDFEAFERALRAHDDSDTMTDETESADAESADDQRDEDGMDATEYRSSMLEMQRQQTETLSTLADALRENDDDDDDEDDDDDDMEGEKAADEPAAERTIEIDGEERTVAEVRDELADLREQASEAEAESPETQDRADEESDDAESDSQFGFGAME